MPVNDQLLVFNSKWTIQKLVKSGQVTVNVPSYNSFVTIANISDLGLSRPPSIFASISYNAGVTWFLSSGGTFITGTGRGAITLTASLIQLRGNTDLSGNAAIVKYWVFSGGITAN